jgi:hypothetical protein
MKILNLSRRQRFSLFDLETGTKSHSHHGFCGIRDKSVETSLLLGKPLALLADPRPVARTQY